LATVILPAKAGPGDLMVYRGKRCMVLQGVEPDSWKWSVNLDDDTTKSGEAKSRGSALAEVVLLVDRAALARPVKTE
jgi:hypothetical protein